MATSHGFPPYSEFLLYDDVLEKLSAGEVKVMCWLLGNAKPAGEAAWCVAMSYSDLAARLNMSTQTVRKHMQGLARYGYIHIGKGTSLGRNNGGTSQTYYLTHHSSLGRPRGGNNPSRSNNREGSFSPAKDSPTKHSPAKKSPVYRLPTAPPVRAETEIGSPESSPPVVLGFKKEQTSNTTTGGKENISPTVRAALTAIGWNFAAFDVPDVPEDVLLAAVRYARSNKLGAGWLNVTAKKGILADTLRDASVFGTDTQQRCGPPLNAPGRLTGYEWDVLAEQHPDWAQHVREEARRLTPPEVPYVAPSLVWEVAYQMRDQIGHSGETEQLA